MGFERGSVIIFQRKFYLFDGYSTDNQQNSTYLLQGLDGENIEVLESECIFLLSPSELDYSKL